MRQRIRASVCSCNPVNVNESYRFSRNHHVDSLRRNHEENATYLQLIVDTTVVTNHHYTQAMVFGNWVTIIPELGAQYYINNGFKVR